MDRGSPSRSADEIKVMVRVIQRSSLVSSASLWRDAVHWLASFDDFDDAIEEFAVAVLVESGIKRNDIDAELRVFSGIEAE